MLVDWNGNGFAYLLSSERNAVESLASTAALPINAYAGGVGGTIVSDSSDNLFLRSSGVDRFIGVAGEPQRVDPPTSSVTGNQLNVRSDSTATVAPESNYVGFNGAWFGGMDVANAPTNRDLVLVGLRQTYTINDAVLNGTTTLTSASEGGFSVGLIGASVSGPGIPSGVTVTAVASATSLTMSAAATVSANGRRIKFTSNVSTDLAYFRHRGALSPTMGIGVTPPDGTARLQVSGADAEPAMGTIRLRVGPSQTAKALTVHDSTPTDQWWIDSSFVMSGVNGVMVQAEPSATGHALQILSNAKDQTYAFDMPTGSGGVMRLRNVTNNITIMDFGTDGSMRHLSPKFGAFSAAPVTKPVIAGSRGGNAALASLLTGLSNLGWVTDNTTA